MSSDFVANGGAHEDDGMLDDEEDFLKDEAVEEYVTEADEKVLCGTRSVCPLSFRSWMPGKGATLGSACEDVNLDGFVHQHIRAPAAFVLDAQFILSQN